MSRYDEYVERYGAGAVRDRLDQEGIEYGICDYYGAAFFEGSPLERAARQFEEARDEIVRYVYGEAGR